jgi:uncharacterized protein (DUF433 family)
MGKARIFMGTEYVQLRDGNIYVGPSRVTIDSVVINWKNGQTPEQIHDDFPTVPLAHIYAAIAYYLEHLDEIDAWIREGKELWRQGWEESQRTHADWLARNRGRLEAIGVEPGNEAPTHAQGATDGQIESQATPELHTP